MTKKRTERDYLRMVEEMAELADSGIPTEDAFNKIKRKYKLNKREGKELMDSYVQMCGNNQAEEDEEDDSDDLDDDTFRDY